MPGPHALIAQALNLQERQVAAAARLFEEGATVPFIARYRKEATHGLDEVQLAAIRDALEAHAALEKRRESVLGSLRERQLLDPKLERALVAAATLQELEDLYLPYRVKRKTRADAAREAGLGPLADALLNGQPLKPRDFVGDAMADAEAAMAGARDIVAERVSDDVELRKRLRETWQKHGRLSSSVVKKKAKEEEAARFRDWFDWSEALGRAPSHRVLALLRGKEAGVLRVTARPDADRTRQEVRRAWIRGPRSQGRHREQMTLACDDAYDRLLAPALEREALSELKARADAEAIVVFQKNLQALLMASPLGQQRVLAIDPGLRTGCKTVVLGAEGDLLASTVLHLAKGQGAEAKAADELRRLVDEHRVEAIAIGNGTGSREAEAFVRGLTLPVTLAVVDEAGASIYSASEVARQELPDQDVTVRGAVSIGRRLQDPLAELVKLDPKSIGVGQYQHDVDQAALKRGLDDVVERCVNRVGVELNNASPTLLAHVAGLGPKLAQAIVVRRSVEGPYRARRDLLKVPRLGKKAFEQAAGFLRIRDGKHPLDASAVHPERYDLVERMAKDAGCDVATLMRDDGARARIDLPRYFGDDLGEPTLRDILDELARPGRDPRARFETVEFADVHTLADLRPGMTLPGVVTNVTSFGAFVDVGVHQDGLVHVSQLADRFVRDPAEVVTVRQRVTVRVLEVDGQRQRISLTMKGVGQPS